MRKLLVTIAVVACRPAAAPAAPAESAEVPAAAMPTHMLAIVTASQVFEECSNLGGEHFVFTGELDGRSLVLHGGAHGWRLGLLAAPGQRSGVYVADIAIASARPGRATGDAGWCLDRMPAFDGDVLSLVPATDADDAARMIDRFATTGLPPAWQTTGDAHGQHEDVAIARVIGLDRRGRFQLEAVDGDVPATIDRTAYDGALWTGDLLVVATAGGSVTRVMRVEDRAVARAWAAAIADDGWPPQPIVVPYAGNYAEVEWATSGTVTDGGDCGASYAAGTDWYSARDVPFVPPKPLTAAAPPGATSGETITAIVVPQPVDACGRNGRIVRAYATQGIAKPDWLTSGKPAPAAALVE